MKREKIDRNFPTKKDLTYWILFLILINIFVYVLFIKDPSLVNSKLSLASTITSIALALIAILFSFVQSSDSSNQNNNLLSELAKVTTTIEKLQKVSESIEERNTERLKEFEKKKKKIKNIFNEIESKIGNFNPDSGESISDVKEETLKKLEELKKANSSIKIFGPKSLLNLIREIAPNGDIHIQVLWETLYNRNINITMNYLLQTLEPLQKTGMIEIIGGSGGNSYIRLTDKA